MSLRSVNIRRKATSSVILYILAFIWIIPLLWAVSTSLKSNIEISQNPLGLIPKSFDFSRYKRLLFENPDQYPVFSWLKNSLFVAFTHTILYLIIASLAAYAFSIIEFKLRDKLFWLILSTSMIPGVINLVPMFTMIVDFNWMGDFKSLIIPGLGGVFGLLIIRQFFLGIPKELIESAKVDGLGHFQIFLRIVVPLSRSAFLVAGLFVFLGNWNDYLWPLITMSGSGIDKYTLPAGLSIMQGSYGYDYGLTMTAAIISAIPVLIIFMFTQEKIIQGISRTGIK